MTLMISGTWPMLARRAVAAMAFLGATALPAIAGDDAYDGNWHFTLTPYVWLPGVTGDLKFTVPRFPDVSANANVDEGPIDILKHLRFGLMGTGDARNDNWSVFTDMIYVSLSGDKAAVRTVTGPRGIVEIPVNIGTTVDLKSFVWTNGVGYSVYHQDTTSADVFVGFRYVGISTDLDWSFSAPLSLLPRTGSASAHDDVWDGLIGVRGQYGFAGTPWFVPYYADVGTGSSDVTFQLSAGVGYAFPWGDMGLLYRYLYYKPGGVVDNMALHGPLLAVRLHF